jgi:hypothetical protein
MIITSWLNFIIGKSWYDACKNRAIYSDGKRTRMLQLSFADPVLLPATYSHLSLLALKFRLALDMTILGLPGHRQSTVQIADAECPIELPINSA